MMIERPSDKSQILNVMQVLIGAVSPNFRMVWLERKNDQDIVHIVLENSDGEDEEEIHDMEAEFEAVTGDSKGFHFSTSVDNGPLKLPTGNRSFVVFRRRE